MTILDKRVVDYECDVSSNFYEQFWNDSQFHIADGYTDTFLGSGCITTYVYLADIPCNQHSSDYILNSIFTWRCEMNCSCVSYHLPLKDSWRNLSDTLLEGVNITWNASNKCTDCPSSYRNYDIPRFPNLGSCYCAGISYSGKYSDATFWAKITLGAIGLFGILVLVLLLLIAYWRKLFIFNNLQICVLPNSKSSKSISKVEKFLQYYSDQMPTRFSYSQLKRITNNFADKVGEGGFGVVYKGKLRNGYLVAVKIIDQTKFSEIQFMNEVATIGRTHHVHLVRLIGYCSEAFRKGLVYEYMVNGSLDKFIFVEKGKQHILSWEQLYSIALGVARGIAYLHQDCDRRIIHFDIKPHNILLDAEFTAKVSDFGLAKLCGRGDDNVSITRARGTPGYVAPEVSSRNLGPVTEKSDVYSFGMLLLEIVGGRKNIDVQVSRPSEVYFPEWAFRMWEKGELETWLRGKREMECEEEEKARRLTKIGLWCIQYSSIDRPSMNRVVQMLEGNGDDVSNPPFPFNST